MRDKRAGKKTFITLIITAVIAIAAYAFYRIKKEDFLEYKLQNLITEKTNRLYKINYDSIWVNEAEGNLYIKNLSVKGDTSLQVQMLKNNDSNAAKLLFDISIPQLKVESFKTARAVLSKKMDCEQVIISNPKVTIYLFPGQRRPPDVRKQQQELYKQILGDMQLIKAGSISVTNSEVVAVDFYTKEIKFKTYNTSIGLSEVAIDSAYNQDRDRTFFCKEITIKSEKVILGEKNKTAEITDVSFDTRTNIVTLAKLEYDAFKHNGFFKSSLEGISLKGITWSGPVEDSDLAIDEAILNKGDIETLRSAYSNNKKRPQKDKVILTGWIKSLSLNSFSLKSFTWLSKSTLGADKTLTLRNNSLEFKNLLLDRTAQINESLLTKFRVIELSNDLISLSSNDKAYQYRFRGCRLNTATKKMSLKSIRIIPTLNEADFARKAKYQADRYDINIQNAECTGVNFEKLVNGEIDIQRITTSNNSIKIFRDLSYPIDSASKEENKHAFPHQILHNTDLPINIEHFAATKTYIEYKEKNAKSKSSGRVKFSNSSITIDNISNDKPYAGEKTTLRFSANFLEKIPLDATIHFYSAEWKKGKFSVVARIDKSFDAVVLNQVAQPMALTRIEKGIINSLRLNITADTGNLQGSLTLPYENMKISLLRKGDEGYNKKDIFSLLANVLVKNKNKEGPGMRIANINIKRNSYKSFFNYIWMSLFTGMKDIFMVKI